MATPTLDDLLTIPTQQQVLDQEVLPELKVRQVRVTDWIRGGVYRAMAFVVAMMRMDSRQVIATIAAGGFEDYAFGFSQVPGGLDVTSWCDLVGKNRYGLDRIAATRTERTLRLTNSVAASYGPIAAGDLVVEFTATGNRYRSAEEITIPASDYIDVTFESEFASDSAAGLSYNDASDATIVLVTSNYPGVSATNPAPDFSDVAQVGSGVGTLTPSGTPDGPHSVSVRIDTSGQAASIAWSTSLDGGAWTARSGATLSDLDGTGIDLDLDNDGGNPAFAAGTVYSFETPGSDITQVGRDLETPQEYGTRCRAMWPSVAVELDDAGNAVPMSPTASAYELLARRASDQVKICFIDEGSVNNEVLIYVAGQGVLLSSGTIAAIQEFIDSRSMITDYPVVASPTTGTIELGGITIVCRKGWVTAAQVELQRRLQIYFGGVDADEPVSVNPLISHEHLVTLIKTTPGVKRFNDIDLEINGTADDLQLPIAPSAYEIAVWSEEVATVFDWTEE